MSFLHALIIGIVEGITEFLPISSTAHMILTQHLLGIAESDFVSVHTPLLPETRHMMSADQFARMKPGAIFINTSRGPVVDQIALYEALKEGRIAGAGLDVFETEPLPMDDPLLKLDNVVLLPHIASASVPTRTRMAVLTPPGAGAIAEEVAEVRGVADEGHHIGRRLRQQVVV